MDCSNCACCNVKPQISAVILDLDGTLLDTETGSKGVLKEFLAKYGKVLDEENNRRLGKTLKESAISVVEDYDLPLTPDEYVQEIVPVHQKKWLESKPLPGANRLIQHLYKHGVPFALASNSLREFIDVKISNQQGWKEKFSVILGSDNVENGKPAPDLFLEAARRMNVDAARCLVFEDSLVGVKAAKAAKMKVVAIPSLQEADCRSIADAVLNSLLDFQPDQWGLAPFEDWVHGALPLETIYLSCQHISGFFYQITEDEKYSLPEQASGIYIGQAQIDIDNVFKVVVGITYNRTPSSVTRKLAQLDIIDGSFDPMPCQLQLSLVGFIRGFRSKEMPFVDPVIVDEDKSIAREALELPTFTNNSSCCNCKC